MENEDGCDAIKDATTESLALRRESLALLVVQAQALPTESSLEGEILLLVHGVDLVPVGPARERGEEELEREDVGRSAR